MKRVPRRLLRCFDVVLAVGMALFMWSVAQWATQPESPAVRWTTVAAALASGIVLYWRRRFPVHVMAVSLATGAVTQFYASHGLFPYAALIALWAITARRRVFWSLPALAGVLGLTWLAKRQDLHPAGDIEFAMVVVVAVWAFSFALRSHRLMIEQAAARVAVEDQARLARDIHDVIAHSVSVIVVQAAAADDVFEARPDRAREALRSIEATGRDALSELRRLLAADPAVNPELTVKATPPSPVTTPQPTLARLRPDIVAPIEAAGLDVDLVVDGDMSGLPLGVQLTAFRIVQESLTNVLRHGRGAGAQVRLLQGERELQVVVENMCRGDEKPRPQGIGGVGRGIVGMRERATLVGGVLEAGPTPDDGFRVVARLPVKSAVRL
nr:histidine kinase [Kineosporia babensis]